MNERIIGSGWPVHADGRMDVCDLASVYDKICNFIWSLLAAWFAVMRGAPLAALVKSGREIWAENNRGKYLNFYFYSLPFWMYPKESSGMDMGQNV